MRRHLSPATPALLVVLALVGCGRPVPTYVAGKITYDGAPVPEGLIALIPLDNTPGDLVDADIVDGAYEFLPPVQPYVGGTYRVEITRTVKPKDIDPAELEKDPEKVIRSVRALQFPARYNVASELIVTIENDAGQKSLDFAMEKDKEPGEPKK